jgi:PKD repeat protein
LTVQFNDTSANSPTSWNWSFGDTTWFNTTSSSLRNVSHIYTNAGTYSVMLTASNAGGSNTKTIAGYITVSAPQPPPVAAFSGTPTAGTAPLKVIFKDSSTNTPTSWNWTFGDGSLVNITDKNPVHTYTASGIYDVSLNATNAAGSNIFTRTGYITIFARPAVTVISPASGPTAGGTVVTLTGTGFTGATAVIFGTTAGTSLTVNSDTKITIRSPAHASGTVDITVTTPGGASVHAAGDRFTYIAPPTVTSVSPNSGWSSSRTMVTVTGTGFTGATAVNFGTAAGDLLTVVSPTRITIRSPPLAAGTVNVIVTTAGGTSATSPADRFTYVAPPTILTISPTAGPTVGGTTIIITGSNFISGGAFEVAVDYVQSAHVVRNSDTQITATTPPGTIGSKDVFVRNNDGQGALKAGGFTYVAAPTVTGISPVNGPATGGTTVTITGTALTGATAVRFGTTPGTILTNTATTITVTSPAHTAGVVDVTVTTPGGTSAHVAGDRFTYIAPPRPTVSSLSPATGHITGGTLVTVTGTGFTGATVVKFGTTAGTSLTVNSDTQITVLSPPLAAGVVDVTVTTPGGTSPVKSIDQFTVCTPIAGADIIVTLARSPRETQIAQTTTDSTGIFSFTVPPQNTRRPPLTYIFNFYITAPAYTVTSNKITTVANVSDGPDYSYALCFVQGPGKAQGKGSFAVSGKSAA